MGALIKSVYSKRVELLFYFIFTSILIGLCTKFTSLAPKHLNIIKAFLQYSELETDKFAFSLSIYGLATFTFSILATCLIIFAFYKKFKSFTKMFSYYLIANLILFLIYRIFSLYVICIYYFPDKILLHTGEVLIGDTRYLLSYCSGVIFSIVILWFINKSKYIKTLFS